MLVLPLEVNLRLSGVEHFLFLNRILKVFYQNSRKNSGKITKKGEMFKMTRKARSHDVLGKLSAFSIAVILLLSAFVPTFASTVNAGAAASATVTAGERFTIHLDSAAADSWADPMQVRFTDSSGNTLATQSISAPAVGSSVTVTAPEAAAGATNIVVDNLDSTRKTIKDEIAQKSAEAATQGKVLVLYDNTSSAWSSVYYYVWKIVDGTTNKEAVWPGTQMTDTLTNNSNIYYKYINQSAYPNIIFSNNGASQTDNLLTPTGSANLYDSAVSKWTEYSDIVNSASLSVADRADAGKNHLYLTGEKAAKWSKYGDTIDLTTIYFKPSASWENAYVTYDEDDPYSTTVSMTKYTPNTENPDAPLIFTAQVPAGAKLTFTYIKDGETEYEVKNIKYDGDASNNTYIQASTQWDTLEKALATASKNVDYTVTANNFSTATPSSGQKVVGVNATYFDYLSNNELTSGWRKNLNDGNAENAGSTYRMQFSQFNNLMKSVAINDGTWRYPLFFGDDFNAESYINSYYNALSGTRTPAITQSYFKAANNSNFLPSGETNNMRSVLGLVQNSLYGGNLMVTRNTQAPWFNNDLLKPTAEGTGDSGSQTINVNAPSDTQFYIKPENQSATNFYLYLYGGTATDVTVTNTITDLDGTKYFVVNSSDLTGNNTHIIFKDANDGWTHQSKGEKATTIDSLYGKCWSAYEVNGAQNYSITEYTSGHFGTGTVSDTSKPASDEIWIESKDITQLQFGFRGNVNVDTSALGTVTVGDVTYYIIKNTNSQIGSFTDVGWTYNGWHQFSLSSSWGKAYYNTGTEVDFGSTTASQYAKIIDSYFPFVATTDSNGVTTYSFDSTNAKDNVYFNWDTTSGAPTQVNYGAGSSYGVKNKLSSDYGIFPFNNAGDSARNYGFGIKMEMEFTLPMNGVYGSGSTVEKLPIKTESSGTYIKVSIPKESFADTTTVRVKHDNGGSSSTLSDISGKILRPHDSYTTDDSSSPYGKSSSDNDYYYVVINRKPVVGNIWTEVSLVITENDSHKTDGILVSGGSKTYDPDTFSTTSSSSSDNHAKFEYTGDDDLWVFIDGQLVLDLGGAHTPSTGSIDFGAGVNTVTSTASSVYAILNAENNSATSGSSGTYSTDIVKDGASVTNTFAINNTDPTRKHTMTVFYMERGTNDSNLRVSYTIQPVQNDLTVNKEVSIPDINSGIASDVATAVANSDFGFTLSTEGSAYANKGYAQTSSDGTKSSMTTNSTGGFTLKQNYSANFTKDLTYGDLINISESVPSVFSYDTYYTVKDNKTDTALGTYPPGSEAAFSLINKVNTTGDPDSGASVTVNYTNTLKKANLTLDKDLYQENGTTQSANNVPFEYTVEIDLDGDGAAYSYQTYDLEYTLGGTTKYTATDGKLSIRPDQTATFINIPVGAKYRITETVKAGYVIESISGATTTSGYVAEGTITDGGSGVLYKNKEKPASSGLQAQKTLDGNVYSGSDFSFSAELIRRDGGATIENAALKAMYATDGVSEKTTVDQNGYISFEDFTVIASSENKGKYVFKITESPTAADSPYNYDNTVYYAVIEVTEGSVGTPVYYTDVNLTSLVAADGKTAPTFANTTKGVDVQFTKVNESGNGMNGVEFKIYTDSNCTQQYTTNGVGDAIGTGGTVTSAKVNDADGVVKVEKMAYSTTAATTYYFKETKTLSGYQLLADPVVVTIATDGTYTVSYNGTTLTDNKVTNITQPELPSAGGVGVTMFYVIGALAVVVAGTVFILYKKRINIIALAAHLIHRK